MKKQAIFFLILSILFASTVITSHASSPKELSLHFEYHESYEKNGRQYLKGAAQDHGDGMYLTLYGNTNELFNQPNRPLQQEKQISHTSGGW